MNPQEAENYDTSQEQQEEYDDSQEDEDWAANVPEKRKEESLYTLFQRVWRTPDSSKVANLDKYELGKVSLMNVRDSQYLALLGNALKHPKFSAFFNTVAEITLKTSASKKGWFTELFVSQKKFTQRASSSSFGNLEPPTDKKKKWTLLGNQDTNKPAENTEE